MSLLSKNGRTIEVPRIYRDLDLSEYAEGLPTIKVWVNPPRSLLMEYHQLQDAVLQQPDDPRQGKDPDELSIWDRARGLFYDRVQRPRLSRSERDFIAWYGELWSPDGSEAFGESEVLEFAEEIIEQDPELWAYMAGMTWRLIGDHRESAKKNWLMRSSVSPGKA